MKCNFNFTDLTQPAATADCPKCGLSTNQLLSSGGASATFEMRDRNRGKQVKKGVEKQLKKRMVEHHNEYEVAEKIDKFGLDEAKKFGWDKKAKKI